jgi:hypothetical protein
MVALSSCTGLGLGVTTLKWRGLSVGLIASSGSANFTEFDTSRKLTTNQEKQTMSSAASTPSTPPGTSTASTRKACDPCRASKARCEPEPDDASGACQRCRKTGRMCVFGERSRRRKRLKVESGDEAVGGGSGGNEEESKVERLERKVYFLEARLGVTGEGREDGTCNRLFHLRAACSKTYDDI